MRRTQKKLPSLQKVQVTSNSKSSFGWTPNAEAIWNTWPMFVLITPRSMDAAGELLYSFSASPNTFEAQLRVRFKLKNGFEKASLMACNVLGEMMAEIPVHAAVGTILLADELDGQGVYLFWCKAILG